MKWWVAVVTGIQIALIATFIYFFTRRFRREPDSEAHRRAQAVSAMELDKHIDVHHGSEEIDELVTSFDGMKDRLREALGEIRPVHGEARGARWRSVREQLKMAQQKLIQSDRLASLGQLSASVAHEINNPVAGVLNLSMLMQRILRMTACRRRVSRIFGSTWAR